MTLVPSHDSNGTNALLLAPPDAIAPCFGPGSFCSTCRRPWRARIDVHVLHLPGLALDIDEPRDLAHCRRAGRRALRFPRALLAGLRGTPDRSRIREEP